MRSTTEVSNPTPLTLHPITQKIAQRWLDDPVEWKRQQQIFLDEFAKCATLSASAKRADISRKTIHIWRKIDPDFNDKINEIREQAHDEVEETCYEMAKGSLNKNGQREGHPLLIMFYLKAKRPEFRDRITVDLPAVQKEIEERLQQLGIEDGELPLLLSEGKDGVYALDNNASGTISKSQVGSELEKLAPRSTT